MQILASESVVRLHPDSGVQRSSVPVPRSVDKSGAEKSAEQVKKVVREFEAILLRQVLAQARKPLLADGLGQQGMAASIYQDMVTDQLAESMSKAGGMGLSSTLERQLTQQSARVIDSIERTAPFDKGEKDRIRG